MLDRLLRSRRVHRGDARDAFGRRLAGIDDDEWESLPLQHPQFVGGLFRQHQDRSVGCPAHQALEQRHLTIVLVQRRREHDPHVPLVQSLGSAAQNRAEVRVGDERQGQTDHPRAATRQPARTPVRAEAGLAHDLQDALARLTRHIGPVVQDPRDSRDRDAGEIGDVPDRRAAPERWLRLSVGLGHLPPIQAVGNVSGNSRSEEGRFSDIALDKAGRCVVTVTGNFRNPLQIAPKRPPRAGKERNVTSDTLHPRRPRRRNRSCAARGAHRRRHRSRSPDRPPHRGRQDHGEPQVPHHGGRRRPGLHQELQPVHREPASPVAASSRVRSTRA